MGNLIHKACVEFGVQIGLLVAAVGCTVLCGVQPAGSS